MTYKPDFTSSRAKLERAKEHLEIFEREAVASFAVESNRVGLSIEFDPKSGYHIYRVATLPPEGLLLRFGLIIGDIVHNLRGALDHLVWQLSLFGRNGRQPRNPMTVQFPIVTKPIPGIARQDFMGGKKQPLWDVVPDHRAIIEGYQPYNPWRGSGKVLHPFARLRNLSNDDKHREVKPVPLVNWAGPVLPDMPQGVEWEVVDVRSAPLIDTSELDAEVSRVKFFPPTLQLDMQMARYFAPTIALSDPVHRTGAVDARSALGLILVYAHEVIGEFEPLF